MKLSKSTKKTLEEAIELRARAKVLEEEAKSMTQSAKDTIHPIMIAHDMKDYQLEGVGKVIVRTSKGSSISAVKLREGLLLQGMDAPKIERAIAYSSNTWSKEYIEFKRDV